MKIITSANFEFEYFRKYLLTEIYLLANKILFLDIKDPKIYCFLQFKIT